MIRPMTLLSMLAAAGAGLYLYQVKHSVAELDRELRSINRQTEQARERTQILRAEWALLNEPERLLEVAQRYLPLQPMAPTQFVRLSDLDRRLPAARVFAAPTSLFAPVDPAGDGQATALALADRPAAASAAPAAPVITAAAEVPAAAPPAPTAVASIAPAVVPEPEPVRPAPRSATPREPVRAAEAPAPEPRRQAPQRLASAATRPAPPAPRPTVQRAVHVQRASQPAPQVQRVSAPAVTSVLAGGGPALAPPVPIARAAAATLSGSGVR